MKKIITLGVIALLSASMVQAAPSAAYPSMSVTKLTGTLEWSFTSYGGLVLDGDVLYFGNDDVVRSYNTATSTEAEFAVCGSNAGIGTVNKLGTEMYMSKDTSYNSPYPSNFGTIDPADDPAFTATMSSGTEIGETTYSIYDSAVYGGNLYFVANVGTYVDNGQGGKTGQLNGTSIFRYDTANPTNPVEIAVIGGSSGGLTFDASGNLYYASQNTGEGVLKFTAAEVAAGGLTAADGDIVVDIVGGSLGFLSDGTLLAETGSGQLLAAYDPATGDKLYDIATTTGWDYMGKFVVDTDDAIYILSNDWNAMYYGNGDGAVLSAITVPEPTTLGLLLGGVVLLRRRRN